MTRTDRQRIKAAGIDPGNKGRRVDLEPTKGILMQHPQIDALPNIYEERRRPHRQSRHRRCA
ncbi:MAG: hypothetical protein NZL99_03410 [Burkholderiaceae bacterium]|nr:hypothetical protein [Burkholderiaceae bacterium]